MIIEPYASLFFLAVQCVLSGGIRMLCVMISSGSPRSVSLASVCLSKGSSSRQRDVDAFV